MFSAWLGTFMAPAEDNDAQSADRPARRDRTHRTTEGFHDARGRHRCRAPPSPDEGDRRDVALDASESDAEAHAETRILDHADSDASMSDDSLARRHVARRLRLLSQQPEQAFPRPRSSLSRPAAPSAPLHRDRRPRHNDDQSASAPRRHRASAVNRSHRTAWVQVDRPARQHGKARLASRFVGDDVATRGLRHLARRAAPRGGCRTRRRNQPLRGSPDQRAAPRCTPQHGMISKPAHWYSAIASGCFSPVSSRRSRAALPAASSASTSASTAWATPLRRAPGTTYIRFTSPISSENCLMPPQPSGSPSREATKNKPFGGARSSGDGACPRRRRHRSRAARRSSAVTSVSPGSTSMRPWTTWITPHGAR